MKEFTYTINDPLGIHARPAGIIVKRSSQFKSRITITKEGKEVDAKRILGVISLCVRKDHEITVRADGEDEDQAIEVLSSYIKSNL